MFYASVLESSDRIYNAIRTTRLNDGFNTKEERTLTETITELQTEKDAKKNDDEYESTLNLAC